MTFVFQERVSSNHNSIINHSVEEECPLLNEVSAFSVAECNKGIETPNSSVDFKKELV